MFCCSLFFVAVAKRTTGPIAFKSVQVDLFECGRFFGEGLNVSLKLGNSGGELSDGELLAFDCCGLHVNKRIFGRGSIGKIIKGINEISGSIGSSCCMDPKDRMLVSCHVMHFWIVGDAGVQKVFRVFQVFWAIGSLFHCLYVSLNMPVETACLTPVWTIVLVLMRIFALVANNWN